MIFRPAGAVALAALVVLGAAGCTSSGGTSLSAGVTSAAPSTVATSAPGTPAPSSAAPSTPPVRPTTTISTRPSTRPTPTRPSSPRPTTSPVPSTSSRPEPTTTATLTAPPAQGGTCTAAQLSLQSMRGGASQGREYAAVSFTNTSGTTCTMRGYPAAQLLRGGALLGNPAAHDTTGTVRTVQLEPHASAQSVLSAVSTCQSPLSDHVRVIVPGSATASDVAIQLRACSLTIGPLDLP